jgi:hypothetical protein
VASDVYNGAKAAAGAVLDKIRNEPPDPPPSSGSASDSEA